MLITIKFSINKTKIFLYCSYLFDKYVPRDLIQNYFEGLSAIAIATSKSRNALRQQIHRVRSKKLLKIVFSLKPDFF
jgi:hypothetical protein